LTDKLLFIFNLSTSTGIVPKAWKIKRISPIYTAGDKDEPGNYRPVSVTSTPMKTFEKTFILNNDILHPN